MTSIDRARSWARKVSRTALVVAPLALAAASAHAAVVFDPMIFSSGGSCVALPAEQNAPNGVSGVKCFGSGVGVGSAVFSVAGVGSGVFDESTIPFEYDFTVDGERFNDFGVAAEGDDWEGQVVVTVNGLSTSLYISGLFGEQKIGGFAIDVPNGQALTTWSISIFAVSLFSKSFMKVDVPNNSAAINRGTAVVPEPGTVALLGAGLLGLGLIRRRR